MDREIKKYNSTTGQWESVYSGGITDGTLLITPDKIGDLSTLQTQTKSSVVGAINEHESKLSASNATTVTLSRGQNLVTTNPNGASTVPFNVLSIKGRTLINLLGRDGNCEDVSKWSTSYLTLSLDNTNQIYGSNAFKATVVTGSTVDGTGYKDVSLVNTKYYVTLAQIKNGNATNIKVQHYNGSTFKDSTAITGTTYTTVYIKLAPTDIGASTNRVYFRVTGSVGAYAYIDGIRLFEISQTEYNAIDTMTTDQIAQKYPYIDDMKSLVNPSVNVFGQNVHSPFASADSTIHANADVVDLYSLDHTPTLTGTGTTTYDRSTPVSVVGSAYDTSGNGGRKLVRLSNGWLVALTFESSGWYRLYGSKDNGVTWSFITDGSNSYFKSGGSIVSNGTKVTVLIPYADATNFKVHTATLDATTLTWGTASQLYTGTWNWVESINQTAIGTTSLTIDTNGKLWAAWASKNSTYPNSFNIRVSSSTDGATWATPTQLSTVNSSGLDLKNPCIVIKSDGNPLIVYDYTSASKAIGGYNYNGTSWSQIGGNYIGIYNGGSYSQSNPSAVVDSSGVIHAAWHGTDSTDTTTNNIRYSKSTDSGATWSSMTKLTSGNSYNQYYPSITTDKSNKIYVVWHGYDAGVTTSYVNIRKITSNDGVTWGSVTTLTSNTTASTTFPSTLANYTDFTDPLVIYQDNQAGKVQFRGVWSETVATTISSEESSVTLPVIANQQYSFSMAYNTMTVLIQELDRNGTVLTTINSGNSIGSQITWTTGANTVKIKVIYRVTATGTYSVRNPMLNLGTPLSFVARNDSPVYFQTSLASSVDGTIYDSVAPINGGFVKTARFKEMVLDGSLSWAYSQDFTGYKRVLATINGGDLNLFQQAVKYDGKPLTKTEATTASDSFVLYSSGNFYVTIADTDSGWGETYTPTAQEIQAYFNGYKMITSGNQAGTGSYTGTGTKAWVEIPQAKATPTTTNCVTDINIPLNGNGWNWTNTGSNMGYSPYRLLYQLSQPSQETVTTEGLYPVLSAGANQVELGEGLYFREPAKIAQGTSGDVDYYINSQAYNTKLSNRVQKIVAVYKGTQLFTKWIRSTSTDSYGIERVKILQSDYDPTASYYVSYVAVPAYVSSSILSLDGSYESNLRKDVDKNTQNIADLGERLTAVEISKANRNQPQWLSPTLLNGNTNFDSTFSPVGYLKDEFGFVHLRGVVRTAVITPGSAIYYLPQGYRPSYRMTFVSVSGNGSGGTIVARIDILPSGLVQITFGGTVNDFLSLEGIIFRAEQ